jgi:hypothetical protein
MATFGSLNSANDIDAVQADQETATSQVVHVTPARQQFHPAAAKCWLNAAGAGTGVNASYNITSITDTGPGRLTVVIGTDFSSANWCCVASIARNSTSLAVTDVTQTEIRQSTIAGGTVELEVWDDTATTHVQEDPSLYFMVGLGDQ